MYEKALEVTIVVLIILAGITLNAVIGENGIIFQAKDTKNLVDNETRYDNQQLASLQNELKDNQLYSGIGIIPGTDQGGSSEGGENGTNTQGGNNPGTLVNNNQGGSSMGGENTQKPEIRVIEGEQVAAAFYRSDVTVQILTQDKTQRIKYILSTTDEDINTALYPNGLVRELDIENGGTLTFTKDGEYTITAYAYDTNGEKSAPTVFWFKRESDIVAEGGITLTTSGTRIEGNEWYTSNVTIRVLGKDQGSTKVTYRLSGTAYEKGTIGDYEYNAGEIMPREIEINNGTTIKVATDGRFLITAYTYDAGNNRKSTSETLQINRDATSPMISSFTGEQVVGEGFRVSVEVEDKASGLTANPYTYQYKLATSTSYDTPEQVAVSSKMYTGLAQDKTYDMYVIVKDQAGNSISSDIISKPALWISNNPVAGENINTGKEGYTKYYRTNIDLRLTGQDSINVDISKVTYQVIGTTTGAGSIDGETHDTAVAIEEEKETSNSGKIIQLQADGNWEVKVHTYNKEGTKVSTNTMEVTRDTVAPTVTSFTKSNLTVNGFTGNVVASDTTSGLATKNNTYQYRSGSTVIKTQAGSSYTFDNLTPATINTVNVLVTDRAGNNNKLDVSSSGIYLADIVDVGDYVGYDAGTWENTANTSNTNGSIGKYMAGYDKAYSTDGTRRGWKVLSVDGSGATGNVTLISAGTPFQAYYGSTTSDFDYFRSSLQSFLNLHYKNIYANNVYGATELPPQELDLGSSYWLISEGLRYDAWDQLKTRAFNGYYDSVNVAYFDEISGSWIGAYGRAREGDGRVPSLLMNYYQGGGSLYYSTVTGYKWFRPRWLHRSGVGN